MTGVPSDQTDSFDGRSGDRYRWLAEAEKLGSRAQ